MICMHCLLGFSQRDNGIKVVDPATNHLVVEGTDTDVSELQIGDETFIIAALMAVCHPKSIVLSGALSALFVMTVLSTGLGRIVPNLISRKHTNSAATVVALGLMIVLCCHKSSSPCVWRSEKANQKKEIEQSFILTFVAEWGDRSQIATIALATHKNAVGVAVGACIV
ncbi:hypothetical protein C5167_031098 [Papaver somniferum]|nr:hypothetical protein C5167_031098 [Papaver somniferum]